MPPTVLRPINPRLSIRMQACRSRRTPVRFDNTSLGHSNSGLQTISPGVYCKGLAFTNDAIVNMEPGVYIIDRGTSAVGGAVRFIGDGVTIFPTTSTGKNKDYADVASEMAPRLTSRLRHPAQRPVSFSSAIATAR